jgi:hypothetical protein
MLAERGIDCILRDGPPLGFEVRAIIMVATRLGFSAAAIKVMPDPVYGWRAMVIGPRTTVGKYQPQADRIRDELCTGYELER